MIRLITDTPAFFNDICEVVRLFWPEAQIRMDGEGEPLTHRHAESGGVWTESWSFGGESLSHSAKAVQGGLEEKRFLKRAVKNGLFLLLSRLTGERPPWGALTGIRPTRLLYEARAAGLDGAAAEKWLEDTFFVSEERARLLTRILQTQKGLIERADDEYDLYVGIPFCVTRCAYCSFSSGELGDGKLVQPYLDALEREMRACAKMVKERGLRLRAFYMGGGTPTSLSAPQLKWLLELQEALFPGAREKTVEAGRPDTIDLQKLRALKGAGVNRISVNPQSFSDETLKRIGRNHTAAQVEQAYALARAEGFDDINMDLIAALPGEGLSDFAQTLNKTLALSPESVTVHTLSIKHGSRYNEKGVERSEESVVRSMVELARETLEGASYTPYYLYRQKYMAGNLENVGYVKPGKACLYNIDIMEETTPILALGAGSITKWVYPRIKRIERAPNLRNIQAYIDRADEMAERKRALIERCV